MCLHINCIRKMIAQFCYLRLYLGRETVFCRLLQRMAIKDQQWIETWPESWPKFFHVLMLCLQKNNNKKYQG